MPCTAKTTTQLIIEGGNDYAITIKGNQPRLLTQLKTIAEHQKPWDRFIDIEQTRGRITCRIVKVFTELQNIDFNWVGVQSLKQARTHRYPLRQEIFNGELLHKLLSLKGDYLC